MYFSDSDITGHVVRMFVPSTDQDGWMPESSAAIPLPSHLEGDTLYVGVTNAAINQIVPAWLPDAQVWRQPNNPLNQPDFFAFTWARSSAERFLHSLTPVGQPMGGDFELAGYSFGRQPETGLVIYAVWRPLRPSGPYDMYVHLLDGEGKQAAQSDRLVWPVRDFRSASEGLGSVKRGYYDEGSETDDWLITRHEFANPPGAYIAEIGLARRSTANPASVTDGIGNIRVPVNDGGSR